jgi:hypothetical protein
MKKLNTVVAVALTAVATVSICYAQLPESVLSGQEVKALSASSANIDPAGTILVANKGDKIYITFQSVSAPTRAVVYSGGAGADISRTDVPSGGTLLRGGDAKAISAAYDAWVAGTVDDPSSKADLLSGGFSVSEFQNADAKSGPVGYIVKYLANSKPNHPLPTQCGYYRNYLVTLNWQVKALVRVC